MLGNFCQLMDIYWLFQRVGKWIQWRGSKWVKWQHRPISPQIPESRRASPKHSIRSEWVMTEIRKAREAEIKEKCRKLFSIRLGF